MPTNPICTIPVQWERAAKIVLNLAHQLQHTNCMYTVSIGTSFHKPNIISSFSDGSVFCDRPVFQAHSSALRLVIYSDEFDVNPIGVHASIHKMSHKMLAFYYTLENMSEHLKSKRDVIQLFAICNSSVMKKFGLKAES